MINVFNPVNRYSANDAKLYIWNVISIGIDTLKNDNSQSYILFQILYTKSCSYFFKPTFSDFSEACNINLSYVAIKILPYWNL